MKRSYFLIVGLCALTPCPRAWAQTPDKTELIAQQSAVLQVGEVALEGEIRGINGATGEVTILATAFATPNGRKELNPPKPKTLVTNGQTRLIDLRQGTIYGLGDLTIGLKLRAVGRDGGTGQPMNARALEWSSPVPTIPPDPATPEPLRGLLPPPADSKGVRVRVVDGGFQPENKIFDWSKKTRPVYFLSYRVFEPREAKTTRPYYEWARLLGVRAPDGQMLVGSGAGNTGAARVISFPKVNPQWKSVTAIWETTAPDANADSSGRSLNNYTLSGPLPTRENPTVKPNTQVTTKRGVVLTLAAITCNWEKKTTIYSVEYARPKEAPDAEISSDLSNVVDDQGRSLRVPGAYLASTAKGVSIQMPGLPADDAKTVKLTLLVTEFDEAWKQKDAYSTLEVEVPVAALLKANPPAPIIAPPADDAGALPAWSASDAKFATRIEEVQRGEGYLGLIWVAPADKNKAEQTQTLVETVTEPVELRARDSEGKDRPMSLFSETSDEVFFHSDGTPPVAGETATRFNKNSGKFDATTDFALDVRSFRRLRHNFSVKGLAVAPDSQRAVDGPVGTGTLQLKKIAWLGADKIETLLLAQGAAAKFKGESALIAVFDYTPFAADAKITLDKSTLRPDKGDAQEISGPLYRGDLLSGTTTGALSLVLPAPSSTTTATAIELDIRATEISDEGAGTATLKFPAVTWKK